MVKRLIADDRAHGLKNFRDALRPIIITPADKIDRPAPKFVETANLLRGWKL